MDYEILYQQLNRAGFNHWVDDLKNLQKTWFSQDHHGDFERWSEALRLLPLIENSRVSYSEPAITVEGECQDIERLHLALQRLKPWRKGPYQIGPVFIDSEWHSDFKWNRVVPHLSDMKNKRILDVGCGNGYHAWRMLDHDPELVLGIDPSVLFNMQYQALQKYCNDPRFFMLPIGIQQMPSNLQWFDTVFSMGVLYHRRSPFDHLLQLKQLLRDDGELCLETLVIEGDRGEVLVPESRYARMNNVWFLPSTKELEHWLKRIGFKNVRLVDLNKTSTNEQRGTEWMQFESLPQCLDPKISELTVEGYPAPLRAVFIANR